MPVIVGETVKVITAAVDWPGDSTVPSLSQVTVIGPLAFAGLQVLVVIFRLSEIPPPVFLT